MSLPRMSARLGHPHLSKAPVVSALPPVLTLVPTTRSMTAMASRKALLVELLVMCLVMASLRNSALEVMVEVTF